jgi:glycerol-3-phosphate dehydrogenase
VTSEAQVDVAIVGGGIAGLWLLARLRHAGFSCVLCEGHALGHGQTVASQGIIHGGTKYSLTGKLSGAAEAIGAMPGIWRAALQGQGEPDLSRATILSEHQYLWTTESLGSKLTGFFAGKAMKARMQPLQRDRHPEPFAERAFHGSLYQLDEPVLDTRTLLSAFSDAYADSLLHIDPNAVRLEIGDDGVRMAVRAPSGEQLSLRARRVILTAGAGNEALARALPAAAAPMQRRPLQMVMVRGELPALYAHCLGVSANPRATITSNRDRAGRQVWYVGGQVAEIGANRTHDEQLHAAHAELAEILPWVDLAHTEWATLRVDRAEGRQPGGHRPDLPVLNWSGPVGVAWPTKLALAPRLAEMVMDGLGLDAPTQAEGLPGLDEWPRPEVAPYPWDVEGRTWS